MLQPHSPTLASNCPRQIRRRGSRIAACATLFWLLAACSGTGTGPTPAPTAFVPIQIPSALETATAVAAQSTNAPPGQDTAWRSLGLTGRILFTAGTDGVRQMDLATGAVTTLVTMPDKAWLTAATLSPDGGRMIMAYAPPPPANSVQLGYTSLHILGGSCIQSPAGCAAGDAAVLLERRGEHEAYFSPLWSPDGGTLYFAHFMPSDTSSGSSFNYALERLNLDGSEPELVVDSGLWPSLSRDGARLAYIWFDPQDYSDHMYVADADGSNAARPLEPFLFDAVDSPLFSLDGSEVFFSAVGEGDGVAQAQPPLLAWLDWLMGVRVALAHNVPSDWWKVSVDGGAPTRLTQIYEIGLTGSLSPDGQFMAFLSASGLRVMRTDGSDLTPLLPTGGYGSVQWVP